MSQWVETGNRLDINNFQLYTLHFTLPFKQTSEKLVQSWDRKQDIVFLGLIYFEINNVEEVFLASSSSIPSSRIALGGGHGRHEELDEDDDVSDARREIVTDNPNNTIGYLTDNILVKVDLDI